MDRLCRALALGAVAVAAMAVTLPGSAMARGGSVSIGVGIGPVFPSYGYYHRPHYYYAPPPPVVYYEQPPVVRYAPVPSAVPANPAGPMYRSANGQQCREYQSTVMVGGRPQPVYGTACLEADGTWRIVN